MEGRGQSGMPGFEGQIEGQKLQAVDQVHLNKDGKIDHLIIYMRPLCSESIRGNIRLYGGGVSGLQDLNIHEHLIWLSATFNEDLLK